MTSPSKALDPEAVEKAARTMAAQRYDNDQNLRGPYSREEYIETFWDGWADNAAQIVTAYLAALPGAGEGKK